MSSHPCSPQRTKAAKVSREHITLTDLESSVALGMQRGITTVTFFRGKAKSSIVFIRKRLRAIVADNSWLAGRVVRVKDEKNLRLDFPSAAEGTYAVTDATLDEMLQLDPPNLRIHSKISYIELRHNVVTSKAQLPKAKNLVNKQDLVLRITIVSDAIDREAGFAIVFSMSHNIGDGHTYYAIMNMISEGSEIKPLNTKRDPEVELRCQNAFKEEFAYISSFANMFSTFWKLYCLPQTDCHAYYVDKSRVEAAKTAAKERGADYVSTNDVLISTFGSLLNARLCFMAMNLRNRVEGVTENNAGNHEGLLALDESFYEQPEFIRTVLDEGPPFVAHGRSFPGACEAASSRIVISTNWSSFSRHIQLPDCDHVLQVPIVFCLFESALIFAPRANELAVLYGIRSMDRSRLCAVAPLGPSVSASLFEEA